MAKKTNTLQDPKLQTVKDEIIGLLRSTNRDNIEEVIQWLDTEEHNFFIVPAARLQHDNVKGGLAYHSLMVYQCAKAAWDEKDDSFKRQYPLDSVIISSLLHDVCKKDVYSFDADGNPISDREKHQLGHGHRSVQLLENLGFKLTEDERKAIKWHMGKFELKYIDNPSQDIRNNCELAMQDPFCILIHQADTEASKKSLKEAKETKRNNLSWNAQETKYSLETSRNPYIETEVQIDVFNHNKTIFNAWKYIAPSGKVVKLPGTRQKLLDATKVYREEVSAAEVPARYKTIKTGCANEDCIIIAKALIDSGLNPAILNMANAYKACGDYNTGDSSQEPSLCRASTLSPTLYQYYNKLWAKKASVPLREPAAYPIDVRYGGIYSPVTVFRDNVSTGFALREEPFQTAIITTGALNFNNNIKPNNLEYCAEDGGFTEEGEIVMRDKIRTIYRIALLNGHDSLVLGAFGCGAFKLKPELVSALFKETLEEKEFKGKFHTIVFALMEGPAGKRKKVEEEGKLGSFYRAFGRWE